MTYEEKVKRIYEAMADKTLSKGCMIGTDYAEDQELYGYTYMGFNEHKEEHHIYFNRSLDQISNIKGELNGKGLIGQIIGHPIHIGVVLEWIENNNIEQKELDKQTARKGKDTHFTYTSVTNTVLHYRKDKTKPLPLNPTEEWYEVIDFIIGLLD